MNMIMNDDSKAEITAIRKRMRTAIRESGRSIDEFCCETGLDRGVFYNKHSYPMSYSVIAISNMCGVTTDWILKGV